MHERPCCGRKQFNLTRNGRQTLLEAAPSTHRLHDQLQSRAPAFSKAQGSCVEWVLAWEATPLLSPLIRLLVLLMDVQCTGNQLTAPRPLRTDAAQACSDTIAAIAYHNLPTSCNHMTRHVRIGRSARDHLGYCEAGICTAPDPSPQRLSCLRPAQSAP